MVSTVIPPLLRNQSAPQGGQDAAPDPAQDPSAAPAPAMSDQPAPANPLGAPAPTMPTQAAPAPAIPAASATPAKPASIDLSKMSDDDILGPARKVDLSKMSDDDILGPAPSAFQSMKNAMPYLLGGGTVPADAARDQFFHGTAPGRILDAFGQGAAENWGSEPLGFSPETEKWLKDVGIFRADGKESPWSSPIKAFNEAFMRPLAVAADATMRSIPSAFGSVARGVGQTAEEAGASPTANEQISQDLNIAPFALGDVAVSTPHPAEPVAAPALPHVMQEAQDLKVIGPEGETGWKGSPEAAPVAPEEKGETPAQQAAIADTAQEAKADTQDKTAPEPTKPTVDDAARQIDPGTMDQWTALQTRRDSYRTWLNDFAQDREGQAQINSPHAAEISELTDQITSLQSKMEDTTPRLAKKYAARIDDFQSQLSDAQAEHDKFVQDAVSQDSPDMARVRQALMQTDFRMRDMAPQISDLYRRAQESMQQGEPQAAPTVAPVAEAPPVAPAQTAEQPTAAPEPTTAAPQEPQTVAPVPAEATKTAGETPDLLNGEKTGTTTPEHISQIEQDVTDKLTKAGRPSDEAAASASIIAAHYETRAERFGGAKGSALDLYKSEAPDIATAGNKAKRGTIRLVDGQKPVIKLMQDADASTFMHETGHAWLEELMQDAKTDGVHESVKTDAQTVRDWLGNDGGDITRAQHETFARSFEKYLFTGQAPMPRLAEVFRQFRDWLSTVYSAATGKGVKVSADIRDVFDRLISTNPERQPLLTKEPFGKALADLHETDAEHTPDAMSRDVGHNVQDELTSTVEARPPLGDIASGRTEGIGGGAGNPEEIGGGETGNVEPSGGGNAPSRSEVSGGTGETETEGAGARDGAGATDSERDEGETATLTLPKSKSTTEVPTSPHQVFEPERKPEQYFDRAGNIRLENLNRPEDIKNVLRITAEDNNGFMAERGGVQSLVDQQSTADALGLTSDNFRPNRPPGVSESTWLRAVRDLTLRSATDVRDLMVSARDSGSDADAAAFGKALARHTLIQGEFSKIKAESGRALAANRWDDAKAMVEGVGQMASEATGMTLNQLKSMARDGAALETPAQVSKFINDATKPTMRDKIQYVALNGLISGPVTHMTYEIASMLTVLEESLLERPIAAAYGSIRDAISGPTPGRVYWGEVGATVYGAFKGGRDGVRAAIDAWKSNITSPLPGEELAPGFDQKMGSHAEPPIGGALGTVIGVPGRVVTAMHSFNRNVFYSMNLQSMAVRAANDLGLTGDAMARKIADLTTSPTEDMMKSSIDYANGLAYMQKPAHGSFMNLVERASNINLATKLMMPFTRVAANIIDRAYVERTPIGLLKGQIRDDLMGRNGAAAADFARARMTAGVLIGGALTGLALEGKATGSGPTNPSERQLWMVDHQPYSVRVGDTWVPYKRLGHLGMLMGLGANIAETIHAYSDKGAEHAVVQLAHGIASNVVDESWMAGVSNVLKMIDDPERAKGYAFSTASELVPFSALMRQSANALDPYARDAKGFEAEAQNMVPLWRQGLPPRRNVWGEPVPSPQSAPYALAAAPFQSMISDDPTTAEMQRIGVFPARADRKIRGVELEPQEYDDYARISGRLMKSRLDQITQSPGWGQMPDAIKGQIAKKIIDGSREAARSTIMMQYPDIVGQAVAAKKQALGQ